MIVCAAQVTPVECPGAPVFAPPVVTDMCDSAPIVTFVDVVLPGCGLTSTTTRTWTATDACGNASTCSATIVVEDNTPPMINCPANLTIECDEDTSPANTGMATATDNCSAVADIIITSSDVSTQGTDGCSQFEFMITRTWQAEDPCGNINTCVQVIMIEDSTDPIVICPADVTGLTCDMSPLPTAFTIDDFVAIGGTVGDNCSNISELSFSVVNDPIDQTELNFCPGSSEADRTLTRTYTVIDACGNSSSCEQLFIYEVSTVGPIITSVPADQIVDCSVNAFPQLSLFSAEGECSDCLLYTSPSPRDATLSRMPSSA